MSIIMKPQERGVPKMVFSLFRDGFYCANCKSRTSITGYWALFLGMIVVLPSVQASESEMELLGVQKIWDGGDHNAFTDLLVFQDRFYCVFREASGHVSPDGKVRVLSSPDGSAWESSALISLEGFDLRDPKIVVHPDGKQMMIYGGAAVREGNKPSTEEHSFVAVSSDGAVWSKPEWVAEMNQWLWRVTWFAGKAYGVAYFVHPESRANNEYGTTLLISDDGKQFSPLVPQLYREGGPTEATLQFDTNGVCYCLQRRDGKPSNTALLGISQPPYTEWEWKDLGRYFGGPDLLQLPDGNWIAAGRIHTDEGSRTVLARLDVEKGVLDPVLTLPSDKDTSYPGLLWHNDILWVSYYSGHEGKTSIYLARVSIQ